MNAPATPPDSLFDLSTLPALPQTLIDLIDACNDPEVNIYAVGTIVARDAVISARILQLANSAFLGARTTFSEIEQAVIYLGIDTVRNLAVSVSIYETFNGSDRNDIFNLPQFWHHSLHTAIFTKLLAEICGYPNPAEAYLAGLLHDLGKLLLSRTYPEEYAQLLKTAPAASALSALEKRQFTINHAEASSFLVRHWKLQEHIGEAIELHHTPQLIEGSYPSLTELLYLADGAIDATLPDRFMERLTSAQSPLSPDIISDNLQSSLGAVGDIAKAMNIPVALPSQSTVPAAEIVSDTQTLTQKVYAFSRIQGVLNNLLQAEDTNRIYRVIEESMHILYNITRCVLLLPDHHSQHLQFCCSPANPLHLDCHEIVIDQETTDSVIKNSLQSKDICHSLTEMNGSPLDQMDQQVLTRFGAEILLAIPLPIDTDVTGLFLAGVSQSTLKKILSAQDTVGFLMAHAGARLHLAALSRRHGEELAKRQILAAEQVARSVAHEITNPLAIIQNYIGVLGDKIPENSDVVQELEIISNEIERIGKVSRQLQDLSASAKQHDLQQVDLRTLVSEMVILYRESVCVRHNIQIHQQLDQELPRIRTTPDTLRQLLTILLKNGIEAIGHGGQISITGSYRPAQQSSSPGTVLLTVADNGPGIAPSIKDTLFNAGHSTKGEGHLGLGLAIAKRLATDMAGTLSGKNLASGGAAFTISLPARL